ncbi:MAG: transcriptional regulator [Chloroflexales bacterium]|nr:transcriptional regulator [Chloroflexales bacterium]
MYRYGQYCPIAKALEVVGDRWTLLIVRDLLSGTTQFNELERGLPGISRALLAERLRRLQRLGLVERSAVDSGRSRSTYRLTRAGAELQAVLDALLVWGAAWAFEAPTPEDLNPLLLLWWMRGRIAVAELPAQRVVIQFDFRGPKRETYWLVLTRGDTSICLSHPGFEIDVLVTADLAVCFEIWLGRVGLDEALCDGRMVIDAAPILAQAFPRWFLWSPAAPAVQAARRH